MQTVQRTAAAGRPERFPAAVRPTAILAEDDPDMRALVAGILTEEGCAVSELATAEELARTLLRAPAGSSRPDVVISDDRLTGGRGLTVLREARRRGWSLPLVLITAFGDRRTIAAARRASVLLVHKPLQLEAIRELIRFLIPGNGNPALICCVTCGAQDGLQPLHWGYDAYVCRDCLVAARSYDRSGHEGT